jgi:hypothetical protein
MTAPPLLLVSKKRVPEGTHWMTGKLHSFEERSTKFQQNQKLRIKTAGSRSASGPNPFIAMANARQTGA